MKGCGDLMPSRVLSGMKCARAVLSGTGALSPVEARKTEPSSAPSGTKPVDD